MEKETSNNTISRILDTETERLEKSIDSLIEQNGKLKKSSGSKSVCIFILALALLVAFMKWPKPFKSGSAEKSQDKISTQLWNLLCEKVGPEQADNLHDRIMDIIDNEIKPFYKLKYE